VAVESMQKDELFSTLPPPLGRRRYCRRLPHSHRIDGGHSFFFRLSKSNGACLELSAYAPTMFDPCGFWRCDVGHRFNLLLLGEGN
jgi:hypothetical protein